MKMMKKCLSLVVMVLTMVAMMTTSYAEENVRMITIKNATPGHIYRAYQIFKGGKGEDKQHMVNVMWGTGISTAYTEGKDPIKTIQAITAENQADYMKDFATNHTDVFTEAAYSEEDKDYTITNLAQGYYLVIDETNKTVDANKGDAYSNYIANLLTCCDKEITPKSDVPEVAKKVKENTKKPIYVGDKFAEKAVVGAGYNDVADYNIGDDVPFELIGTTPSTIGDFTSYKYVFHDTLSKGLTYNEGSLKVSIGSKDVTDQFKTITYDHDKNTLTVGDDDIKKIEGINEKTVFKVTYTAKLNANAKIGLPGNENSVTLEYSNNPNSDGTGYTPDDHVIVFTYELDTKKVEGNTGAALKGAKFKLYRTNEETNAKEYAVVTDGKVSDWNETGTELVSDDEGLFKVAGLDDGTYCLEETEAPNGYNKLTDPVKVFITAETENNQTWDGTPADALKKLTLNINDVNQDGDVKTGIVNATVKNTSDVTLPETGSRGSVIFFFTGLSFLAAGIAYMFRKRHE